ncbi:E3 ubiquitin-protein ligase Mdm2 isoform X2 [Syngnathoides biaculeatus]|uniref:E3 ubiquitin-protein ligase Mdm2 isoform X2 n=1 Tax=Syngnathoides biaculeatus TaxID=300417 RepID=UPI002ADE748F|nr:E3 ubiquitin-protein ligase Mdm2 isoform X2 [Syngnathoides biaculeatus]
MSVFERQERCHVDKRWSSRQPTNNMNISDYDKVVRPKAELATLLQLVGATKDVLTLREVMSYLGQYINHKQLYDKTHNHIVHCDQDELGRILGVNSFSVKQPHRFFFLGWGRRMLFAMLAKNLVGVRSEESTGSFGEDAGGSGQSQEPAQEAAAGRGSSPPDVQRRRRRRTRSSRSNDAGSSRTLRVDNIDDWSEVDEIGAKRSCLDSYSFTFDDSLSWCVIGGLGSGRDRHSSQSSETQSNSAAPDAAPDAAAAAPDPDSDNFSVEFEIESDDSDEYSEDDDDDDDDDDSLADDQAVYEVTIYDDDEESYDEDTEIIEADFWRCDKCNEYNPPLPRNCLRCWNERPDWLRDTSSVTQSGDRSACAEAPGSTCEDGVDVPDGKTAGAPSRRPPTKDALPDSCLDPCIICQSRPKNGCIVHGKTGHLMSCYVCARKLKKHNKKCPVCRMPIQAVILTYLS